MKKVAWFGTHPVQYHSPMFAEISKDKEIDLTVYYFSDFSIKGYHDKEFGKEIKWDIPLLEGYKSKILKNYTKKKHGSFFSYLNFGVYKEIKDNNFDLIIMHGWNTFSHMLIFLACFMTFTPYALRGDTNSFSEGNRKGFKQIFRRLFLKTIFQHASAVFYIGEQNKKFYKHFNVHEKKMFKMPFAVNNEYFINYKEDLNIGNEKEEIGIDGDTKVILFSGKLIALKQVDTLIKALKNIHSKYVLLLIGDGKEKSHLETLAIRLNINAKFLGFVNQTDIPKYYWLSDIFVMPSNKEAWGLSINEAMCCECAIVVSDQVGAKDDLVRGNGFIFKYGDIVDLESKLKVLLENDDMLLECKQKSFELIRNYSYEIDLDALKRYFNLC